MTIGELFNVSALDPLLPTFLIATLCLCALSVTTYYSLALAWEVFWASRRSPSPLDPSAEVVLTGGKVRGKGKKVGKVEGSMGKGGRDVRILDGSEIPESPEAESRVGWRRIQEGEVTGSGVRREEQGRAHCGARSKREGGNSSEDLLRTQTFLLYNKCRGLIP